MTRSFLLVAVFLLSFVCRADNGSWTPVYNGLVEMANERLEAAGLPPVDTLEVGTEVTQEELNILRNRIITMASTRYIPDNTSGYAGEDRIPKLFEKERDAQGNLTNATDSEGNDVLNTPSIFSKAGLVDSSGLSLNAFTRTPMTLGPESYKNDFTEGPVLFVHFQEIYLVLKQLKWTRLNGEWTAKGEDNFKQIYGMGEGYDPIYSWNETVAFDTLFYNDEPSESRDIEPPQAWYYGSDTTEYDENYLLWYHYYYTEIVRSYAYFRVQLPAARSCEIDFLAHATAATSNLFVDGDRTWDANGDSSISQNKYFTWNGLPETFPFTPPTDSDNDGMHDDWETANGLDPNDPQDAALDADGDGLTNLQEFQTYWTDHIDQITTFETVSLGDTTLLMPNVCTQPIPWLPDPPEWGYGNEVRGYYVDDAFAIVKWVFTADNPPKRPPADTEADGLVNMDDGDLVLLITNIDLGLDGRSPYLSQPQLEETSASIVDQVSIGTTNPFLPILLNAYYSTYETDGEKFQSFSLDTVARIQEFTSNGIDYEYVCVTRPLGFNVWFNAATGDPHNGKGYRGEVTQRDGNGNIIEYEIHFPDGIIHRYQRIYDEVFGYSEKLKLAEVESPDVDYTLVGNPGWDDGSDINWPGFAESHDPPTNPLYFDTLTHNAYPILTDNLVTGVTYKTPQTNVTLATYEVVSITDPALGAGQRHVNKNENGVIFSVMDVFTKKNTVTVQHRQVDANGVIGDVERLIERVETINGVSKTLEETTTLYPDLPDPREIKSSSMITSYAWGDEIVSMTQGLGDSLSGLTTTNSFYTDSTDTANYGHPKSTENPDGTWSVMEWDSEGRKLRNISPRGMTEISAAYQQDYPGCTVTEYDYTPLEATDIPRDNDHRPRTVRTTVDGTTLSLSYTVYEPQRMTSYQCLSDCSFATAKTTGNALISETLRYPADDPQITTDDAQAGRTKWSQAPDGTFTTYAYSRTGATPDAWVTTVITESGAGTRNGDNVTVTDGTRTVTVYDIKGTLSTTTTDIASGQTISTVVNSNFDLLNRARTTTRDGVFTSTKLFGSHGVASKTSEQGITTTYYFDAMGRRYRTLTEVATGASLGSEVAEWDVFGGPSETSRVATDGTTKFLSSNLKDDAGRTYQTTNAASHVNTVTRSAIADPDACWQQSTITTPADRSTVQRFDRAGNVVSVSGSAAAPVYYVYGTENVDLTGNGDMGTASYVKTVSGTSAAGQEWTKSYTDMLGRTFLSVTSGGAESRVFYNALGQVEKTVGADGETMLYLYNAKGEREYSIVDMNRNGIVDWAGPDRITRTVSEVRLKTTPETGSVAVQASETYIYTETDTAQGGGTLVAVNESSVNGLYSWSTSYPQTGQPVETFTKVEINPASKTQTVATRNPNGTVVKQLYEYGRLSTVTAYESDGSTVIRSSSVDYDKWGRKSTSDNSRNGVTTYQYYDDDRMWKITSPDPDGAGPRPAPVVEYVHDIVQADPAGPAVNLLGTKIIRPDASEQFALYTHTGQLRASWGAGTVRSQYDYDDAGRARFLYTWREEGNDTTKDTTEWTYQPATGRLASKIFPGGNTVSYQYSSGGRRLSRTSGRGIVTTYRYCDPGQTDDTVIEGAGQLQEVRYSDSTPTVKYTHDRLGRNDTIEDASGKRVFAFYLDGAVDSVTYADTTADSPLEGNVVDYTRDALGRTTGYSLTSPVNPGSPMASVAYGYNPDTGRLETITDAVSGVKAGYTRVPQTSLIQSVDLKYDAAATGTYTTVAATTNTHEPYSAQLKGVETRLPDATLLDGFTADEHTLLGQRQKVSRATDGTVWDYTYNAKDGLANADFSVDGVSHPNVSSGYVYDDTGNRLSATVPSTPVPATTAYTPGTGNRYSSVDYPGAAFIFGSSNPSATITVDAQRAHQTGAYFSAKINADNTAGQVSKSVDIYGVIPGEPNDKYQKKTIKPFVRGKAASFTYDDDGNLTSDGLWTYTWDAENRLIAMTATIGPETTKLEYEYDSQGRRFHRTASTSTDGGTTWTQTSDTIFLFSGWKAILETNTTNDPQSTSNKTFLWGIGKGGGIGGLLAMTTHKPVPQKPDSVFYAYDLNGNVSTLFDTTGQVVATYAYSPFGKQLATSGPMADANPYRYSTKYLESYDLGLPTAACELYYFGYRFYDAVTGRWLSRDPLGEEGGLNLYAYCANDGINAIDPLGLCELIPCPGHISAPTEEKHSGTIRIVDVHSRLPRMARRPMFGILQMAAKLGSSDAQRAMELILSAPGTRHATPAGYDTPVTSTGYRFEGGAKTIGGAFETLLIGVAVYSTDGLVLTLLGGTAAVDSADQTFAGLRQWVSGKPAEAFIDSAISASCDNPDTAQAVKEAKACLRLPFAAAGAASRIAPVSSTGKQPLQAKCPLDPHPYQQNPASRPFGADVPPGEYVYVMDKSGVVRIVPDGPHLHPTVLGGGQPATAAGTLIAEKGGLVTEITNISGTFQFQPSVLPSVVKALEAQGASFGGSAIKPFTAYPPSSQ